MVNNFITLKAVKGDYTMDIYGFYAGEIFDAYKYMGAHIENDQVVFRTYAPHASRIELIGEFNNWSGTEMYRLEDNKFFECRVSNLRSGMLYKYRIYSNDGQIGRASCRERV